MARVFLALMAVSIVAVGMYVFAPGDQDSDEKPAVDIPEADVRTAVFAGGCFWCMEPPFEKLPGVSAVESGYTGGHKENPTYEEVCAEETGHVEAVRVTYDSRVIDYAELLEVFWRQIDPTDDGGQFVDRGPSYVSAIFVANQEQRQIAEQSKKKLAESGRFDKKLVTPIRDAKEFYLAEEYHQDFYKKSSIKYRYYRYRSGRDQFIDRVWGDDRYYEPKVRLVDDEAEKYKKPTDAAIKKKLTDLQYYVTQEEGTERPFKNEFWDNKKEGIYVDVVSGEPLFSSHDKFKSGTGWPSFTQPISDRFVVEKIDRKLFVTRTEVRSKYGDSHLGHVFDDGPDPTGLRYCINSAALRFVPVSDLEKEGYGKYLKAFRDLDPVAKTPEAKTPKAEKAGSTP